MSCQTKEDSPTPGSDPPLIGCGCRSLNRAASCLPFGHSSSRSWIWSRRSRGCSLLPGLTMQPIAWACSGSMPLLRNRSQDIRAINEGIVAVLKEKQIHKDMPVFGPENIFWEPRPAPMKWKGLWDKALDIGRALLVDAGKPGFLLDEFWQAFHDLRDEIKKELFLEAPVNAGIPRGPWRAPCKGTLR